MAAFNYKRLVEQEDSFCHLQMRDKQDGYDGRHCRRGGDFLVDKLQRNRNFATGKTFAKHSKRRSESLVDLESPKSDREDGEFSDRDQEFEFEERHHRERRKQHSNTKKHYRARTESRSKSTSLGGSFHMDDVLMCLLDAFAKRDVSGLKVSVGIRGSDRNTQARQSKYGHLPREYEWENPCRPVRHETKKHHSSSPRPRPRRYRDDFEEGTSSHERNRAFYVRKVHHPPKTSREKHCYEKDELKRFCENFLFSKQLKERLGRFSQTYEERLRLLPDKEPKDTYSRFEDVKAECLQKLDSDQRYSQHRCNKIKSKQHLKTGQRLQRQQESYQLRLQSGQERNDQHQSDQLRKTLPPYGQARKGHREINQIKNEKTQNKRPGNDRRDQLIIDKPCADQLPKDPIHHDQPSNDEQLLLKSESSEDPSELVCGNCLSVHSDGAGNTLKLNSGATTETLTEFSDSCGDQIPIVLKNKASAPEKCSIIRAIQEVTKTHILPTVACEPNHFHQEMPPLSPNNAARLQDANNGKDVSQSRHSNQGAALTISPPPFSPILRKPQKVPASALSVSADCEREDVGLEVKEGGDPQTRKTRKRITFCDTPITIYPLSSSLDDWVVRDGRQDLEIPRSLEKVHLKTNRIHQITDNHKSNLVFGPNPESSESKYLKPPDDASLKKSTEDGPNIAKSDALLRQICCRASGQKMYTGESSNQGLKLTGGFVNHSDDKKGLAKTLDGSSSPLTEPKYGDVIKSSEIRRSSPRRLPVEKHAKEQPGIEIKRLDISSKTLKEINRKADCCPGEGIVVERLIPGHQILRSREIYDLKINKVYNEQENSESDSLNYTIRSESLLESDTLMCSKRYHCESLEANIDMFYSANTDSVLQFAESCYRRNEFSASRNKAENAPAKERVNTTRGKTVSSFNGLPPKYESVVAQTGNPKSRIENLGNASCGDVLVVQNDPVSQRASNPFYPNVKPFPLESVGDTNEKRLLHGSPERGVQSQHTGSPHQQLGARRLTLENEADISDGTCISLAKEINLAQVDGLWVPSKSKLNSCDKTDVMYSKVKNHGAMHPLFPPYVNFENSTGDCSSDKIDSKSAKADSPMLSHLKYTSQCHNVSQSRADIPEELSQPSGYFHLGFARSNLDSPNQYRESDFEKPRATLSFKDIDRHIAKSKKVIFQNDSSAVTDNVPCVDNGMNVRKDNGMDVQKDNGMDVQKDNGMDVQKDNSMDIQKDNSMDVQKDKSMDIQKSSHSGARASLECATNAKMMSLFSNDFGCVLSQKDIEFFDAFIRPIEMDYVSKMDPGIVAQALIKEESVVQSNTRSAAGEHRAAGPDSTDSDTEIDTFVECLYEGSPVKKKKWEKPGKRFLLERYVEVTRNEDTCKEHFWMRSKGSQAPASIRLLAYEDEIYITVDNHKTRDTIVGRFDACLSENSCLTDKCIGVAEDEFRTDSMKQFVPGMSKSEIDLLFQDKIESLSKQLVNAERKLAKSHQDVEHKLEFISRKLFEPDTKAGESIRGVEDKLELLSRKLLQTELLLAENNKNVHGALEGIFKKVHEPRGTTGEVSVGTDVCASENLDTTGGSVAGTLENEALDSAQVQETLGGASASTAKSDYASYLALLCATTSGVTFGYLLSLAHRYAESGTEMSHEADAVNALHRYINKDWNWSDPGATCHWQ